MADWLLAALIMAALGILAAWAVRGLARYDRILAGKGNAPAPGSPEPEWVCAGCGYHNVGGICTHCGAIPANTPPVWPQDRATDITYGPARCGARGPADLRCDQPPHDGSRHEQDGIGWNDQSGPAWRPAYLGELPKSPGGDR